MSLVIPPGCYELMMIDEAGKEVWRSDEIEHTGGTAEEVLWEALQSE